MSMPLPRVAKDITPELLTDVIGEMHPGVRVVSAKMIGINNYGEVNVSSSARATFALEFSPDSPHKFATQVVVKMSLDNDIWPAKLYPIYENEINFYKYARPGLDLEVPIALGARYDPVSKRFILIMEDLNLKGAHFDAQSDEASLKNTQAILDVHAKLHATFWESPRFKTDLSYVQTHLEGSMEVLMQELVRKGIQGELEKQVVKRELVGRLGTTEEEMFLGTEALKLHQSKLPQTMVHGDSHFGNSYRLPGGQGGLLDWQLHVRGYAMHDISYMINTSLSIELRRRHERELLAFYRDRLGHYGVANPPDLETLWLEHRRGTLWTFYYGWLTAPLPNYGWELLTIALLRTSAAYEDHETRKVIAQLM